MQSPRDLVWAMLLLPWFIGSFALADESPKLPDQYAQVVLNVEGMI